MQKPNKLRKLDLNSLNGIELINDQQAENLSAGSFNTMARRRSGEYTRVVSGPPGDVTGSVTFNIDAGTPSIGVTDTTEPGGGEGRYFQVEFTSNNGTRSLGVGSLFTGGRIRRKTIERAVANGATGIQIVQQDAKFLPLDPNVNSFFR